MCVWADSVGMGSSMLPLARRTRRRTRRVCGVEIKESIVRKFLISKRWIVYTLMRCRNPLPGHDLMPNTYLISQDIKKYVLPCKLVEKSGYFDRACHSYLGNFMETVIEYTARVIDRT